MKQASLISFFLFFAVMVQAQKEIPLYEEEIPNARKVPDPERVVKRGERNRAFHDTAVPTLTIFTPPSPKW